MTLLLGRSYELDLEARGVAPLLILFCDAWLDGAPREDALLILTLLGTNFPQKFICMMLAGCYLTSSSDSSVCVATYLYNYAMKWCRDKSSKYFTIKMSL